jgi:transposase-like protein
MTFQRKYENAFKQKAVAMVLQKERKVTEIGPILGINEFLIDEWKRHFHPSLTRPRAGDFYGRIRPD